MNDPMQAFMRLNDLLGTYVPETERTDQAEKDWQTVFDALESARAQQAGSGEAVAWVSPLRHGSQVTFQKPEPPEWWSDFADDWYCRPLVYGDTHPSASVPEAIKHQARRVRNYSNPNEVFEAIPLSAFGPESTTTPQPAPGPLPYWKPCNPACDPELNGYRDRGCSCEPARMALSNTAPPAEGAE